MSQSCAQQPLQKVPNRHHSTNKSDTRTGSGTGAGLTSFAPSPTTPPTSTLPSPYSTQTKLASSLSGIRRLRHTLSKLSLATWMEKGESGKGVKKTAADSRHQHRNASYYFGNMNSKSKNSGGNNKNNAKKRNNAGRNQNQDKDEYKFRMPLTHRNVETFYSEQQSEEAQFPTRHSKELSVEAWLGSIDVR